jgi:hypothetical protein
MKKVLNALVAAIAAGAFLFGATEALAAKGTLQRADCGQWNWCAPSEGGQENCDICCGLPTGGFCQSDAETEHQGCLCW